MSNIPGGDVPPLELSNIQSRSEQFPDLVQFFQAQDDLSTTSSQSSGARDIFKAGQRRLRQLAQRPKKGTDAQAKADDATRQLLALQQEGFLPASLPPRKPKKSAPKQSIDSTGSSNRCPSNLSFQSSSRRDVESIGQPWLEGSLEGLDACEMKGGRFSSLDLRDITSLLGAALPRPPQFEDLSHEQPADAKPTGPKDAPQAADSKSSSSTPNIRQTHSNPVAHSLKLFPDTVPTRMPNKGAWRISNGCPSPSIRSLPATTQQDSSSVSAQPSDTNAKPSSSTKDRDASPENMECMGQMPSAQQTDASKNRVTSQGHEKVPLARSGPRPTSLPMGSIDAFPLPAPMRPLPALPEATSGVRPLYGQDATAGRRGLRVNEQQRDPQLPSRSTEERSMGSATRRENHGSMTGRAAPSASQPDTSTDRGKKSSRADASNSKPVTSVRAGPSRADRVRALKKKDISASRIYLQDSDNCPLEEGRRSLSRLSHMASSEGYDETPTASRCTDVRVGSQYERESADLQLSTISSHGTIFPGQSTESHAISTQDGSPHGYVNATSSDIQELSSLPASKRNSQIRPSGGTRSTSVLSERVANDLDLHERSETPLPSSEDEGMDVGMRKQQTHRISSRQRRPKLAPINVDESATRKTRHMRKSSSYDYSRPTTPRNRRSRGLDKASPQSPPLQGSHYYHEPRGGRHRPSYVRELEKRITHLEHQNRTLQAALLAALGVGGKRNVEGPLGGSSTSLSTPHTSRSFSSMTNSSSSPDSHVMRNERRTHRRQPPYRPETWIASPDSSRRSSYGSEASADIREMENMIEDFDFGWESDQPSSERTQLRGRA
ncbi:hypothetical protein APSETT444_006443 [Aspergillus pseudonomiae]